VGTKKQIEDALRSELVRTRAEVKKAQLAFDGMVTNRDHSAARQIQEASTALKLASFAHAEALQEFSDFVVHRKVPERFKDPDTAMSKS
jgi:hypothetical protein